MIEPDYSFLREYLVSEIERLGKNAFRTEEQKIGYLEKIHKMEQAITVSERKWEYGNAINSLKDKILEADVKLSHILPKLGKLKEQLQILESLN